MFLRAKRKRKTKKENSIQEVGVGLRSKKALRDPRERKNKQKKAVQEVFVGLGDENALRDPSKQSKLEETRRKSRIKKPSWV